jgi:PAS domain S-box-containing protein
MYGVLALDQNGRVLASNQKALELLGYERAGDIPADLLERFVGLKPADSTEEDQLEVIPLARGRKVLAQTFPFSNSQEGNTNKVFMLFEFDKFPRLFKKSPYDFEAILENTYDGLYITDGQSNTIMVNKAYERIAGISREEVLGKNTKDSVRNGIIDRSVSLEVIEKKVPVTIVQESRGGKQFLVTGNPVLDPVTKEVILVVNNVRDITELVELRNELHERTLEANRYLAELDKLKAFHEHRSKFLTFNKKMLDILDMVSKVAQFDSNVLITRRDGPFVKINCAGIPEDLFESELFGYDPGAFSGASAKGKKGLLEVADKGTVFLDEIGDMSLRLQAKLLTVIEDKEVARLGSTRRVRLQVRIMAATNQDMTDLIEKKKFRHDLFFRLSTVSLVIPPLKERPEDVIPLMQHFLGRLNNRYQSGKSFEPRVFQAMSDHSFPGNVRELSNIIEQAYMVSKGDTITVDDLPLNVRGKSATDNSLNGALEKMEYEMLKSAMERFGSTYKAAKSLNMNQSTFVRKMKKLNKKLYDAI